MKISSIHIKGFRNFNDEQITFQDSYATILYTLFAIMRSLYMRSHFDHLF